MTTACKFNADGEPVPTPHPPSRARRAALRRKSSPPPRTRSPGPAGRATLPPPLREEPAPGELPPHPGQERTTEAGHPRLQRAHRRASQPPSCQPGHGAHSRGCRFLELMQSRLQAPWPPARRPEQGPAFPRVQASLGARRSLSACSVPLRKSPQSLAGGRDHLPAVRHLPKLSGISLRVLNSGPRRPP